MGNGVLGESVAGTTHPSDWADTGVSPVRDAEEPDAEAPAPAAGALALLKSWKAASKGPGVGGRLALELMSGQQ